MVSGDVFIAIDVWSSKIKIIIAEWTADKKIHILGVGLSDSRGIRKGNILDMDEFKSNVDAAIADAEKMLGDQIQMVSLGLSGIHIDIARNNGIIAVPGAEVTEEDVNRALDISQNGIDLNNRSILKIIPESFSLDLENGIKSPVGMSGKKLEVRSHIISIGSSVLSNIKKGIYDIGIEIADIYPNVLSSTEAVLTRRQKELGVVTLDIGASVTNMMVFEEGNIIHMAVLPIGAEHVTSDLALGLRISIDTAERLKLEYGDLNFWVGQSKDFDEEIDLSKLSHIDTQTISRRFMTEIMTARYEEIFHYANIELKKIGRDGMLPEGVVMTGGGAKMRGILDLARNYLRLPATIGIPENMDDVSGTSINDPVYASVIGTLILSQKYGTHKRPIRWNLSPASWIESFKHFFKKILP